MKKLITLLALAVGLFAQNPPAETKLFYYPSATVNYICSALSVQPRTNIGFSGSSTNSGVITVSAASQANPVSFTATAHGLDWPSASTVTPIVKITGATLLWAGINGVWIATPTSANAFTIPVDSSGFGALTGTLVVTTLSPRTTEAVWKVEKLVFDSTPNLLFHGFGVAAPGAGTAPLTGPSLTYNQICSNRASLSYQ